MSPLGRGGPVPVDEELRRIVPVLEGLIGLAVSIDTAKAEVARRALALGAELVNDVTALRGDPELAGVVADEDAYVCLMHMQGMPRTMQLDPRYDDVVADVTAFLEERLAFAVAEGIPRTASASIPASGSARRQTRTCSSCRGGSLVALGRPVLVGLSRKSTIGRALGDPDARVGSVDGSVGAAVAAFDRGATIFRVHDVPAARRGARPGSGHRAGRSRMTVEVLGIELVGYHGVLEEERRRGQRFLVDVWLEPADTRAAVSDAIEDAVDYRDVVAAVREVSEDNAYHLLEALATAIAETLLSALPVKSVRVRVRKPDVELALPVEHAAVTVER